MVKRSLAVLGLVLLGGTARAEGPATPAPSAPAPSAPAPSAPAPSAPAPAVVPPDPATRVAASSGMPAPPPAVQDHGRLHHAPVSFAEAHRPIRIRADIDHPELVRRAILVYRAPGGEPVEIEFERAPEGPYAAVIPKEHALSPAIEYAIELEDLDATRTKAFATRAVMHTIEVAEEPVERRERAELARIGGRRSVLSAGADFVSFGKSQATVKDSLGNVTRRDVDDSYYRLEGGFSYRLLRVIREFGLRGGIVRGTSPVPDARSTNDLDVGLNYGSPWARFRVVDIVHLDAAVFATLNVEGFNGGAGGAVHLGDIQGSKLSLGFETIGRFGNRFYSRVDVASRSPVMVSAIVEATNTPHASRYGVRLLGELGAELGKGFRASVRGGYQARDSASGGPAFGGTVSYAF